MIVVDGLRMDGVRITSTADLIEVAPHIMGFEPDSSVFVMPLGTKALPHARVDLPTTSEDRQAVAETLNATYGRYARPGQAVAVLTFSEDRRSAELASQQVAAALQSVGLAVPVRLWASKERWVDFANGDQGLRDGQAKERITAAAVLAGRAAPAATRESLAASLVGDRGPVAAELPAARLAAKTHRTVTGERSWAVNRVDQFLEDGVRLNDTDAARLMVALGSNGVRDSLMESMNREAAMSHVALWTDMTRRAPDEVRTPVASVLAFSSWLNGNGARAWCALDQIPADQQDYPLAGLVGELLQNAVPPALWEQHRAIEINETFDPQPPSRGPGREAPVMGTDRPGPDAPRR